MQSVTQRIFASHVISVRMCGHIYRSTRRSAKLWSKKRSTSEGSTTAPRSHHLGACLNSSYGIPSMYVCLLIMYRNRNSLKETPRQQHKINLNMNFKCVFIRNTKLRFVSSHSPFTLLFLTQINQVYAPRLSYSWWYVYIFNFLCVNHPGQRANPIAGNVSAGFLCWIWHWGTTYPRWGWVSLGCTC